MSGKLIPAVLALAALASPVAAGAQAQPRPEALDEFDSNPIGDTSMQLCWDSENADQVDSWSLYMQRGTTAPPPGSPPSAEVPGGTTGVCHRVDGLEPGRPYSFALVGHNEAGDGPRQTLTAATRVPGAFVRSPSGTRRLPWSFEGYEPAALAADPRTGRVYALYSAPAPGVKHMALYVTSRSPGGHWSRRTLITRHMTDLDASIAADDRGDVAVAYNSPPHGPEFRVRRHGRWSRQRVVPGPRKPGDRVDGIALDRAGHLHVLLRRGRGWPSPGARLVTNATGRWSESVLPRTVCGAPMTFECRGLIAADPVTDRITVVARRIAHRVGTVLIADAPARAARMGRVHAVASRPLAKLRLLPTSLTRRAGRIALALRGLPPERFEDDAPGSGLYLATGSSPARMSGAHRIARTTVRDTAAAFVAATGPRTTLLAWQRDWTLAWESDLNEHVSWDRDQQGVWVRRIVRDGSGRLRLRAPTHVDDSAYAQLYDLAADRRGRPVVAFGR